MNSATLSHSRTYKDTQANLHCNSITAPSHYYYHPYIHSSTTPLPHSDSTITSKLATFESILHITLRTLRIMPFFLYWLSILAAVTSAVNAAPAFQANKENILLGAIEDPLREIQIENILSDATKFRNLPPIVSMPRKHERSLANGEIPRYAIDFAPIVHLYSEERYLPYDILKFVTNFHVEYENGTTIPGFES